MNDLTKAGEGVELVRKRIDTLSQIKQLFARSSNSDPDVWE